VLSVEAQPAATYVSKDGEKLFFNEDAKDVTVMADINAYEKKGDIYIALSGEQMRVGSSFNMVTKRYAEKITIKEILK
jgi:hypothetical protein